MFFFGFFEGRVSRAALLAAVTANAGALRRLELRSTLSPAAYDDQYERCLSTVDIDGLLLAAPALQSIDVDVKCRFYDARTLLAGQGQHGVLRIRWLFVRGDCDHMSDENAIQLARDLRLHPSLQQLGLENTPLDMAAVLGALVDATIVWTATWVLNRPRILLACSVTRLVCQRCSSATMMCLTVQVYPFLLQPCVFHHSPGFAWRTLNCGITKA